MGLQARGFLTLTLVVLTEVSATACGGRTLEPAPSADGGADNVGPVIGNSASGGAGNGNNGNGNNGNGNNGNAVVVTTGADTTTGKPSSTVSVGGAGDSVSMVTSTNASTTSSMLGAGDCDSPYDLGSALGSFSGVTAGRNAIVTPCGGGGPETFLLWTAPETSSYRINTFGSEIDTVLSQLLRPTCEGLGVLQCSDDVNGRTDSELMLYAVEGETLTFVVDSYGMPGRFQLEILRADEPRELCGPVIEELSGVENPLFSQALPLDDSTLFDSSTDMCNGMVPRVAFDWKAPADGTFSFDTVGSNYDTVLVLRATCSDTLGLLCADDNFGAQSQLSLAVWAGQIVRVEIAAFGGDYSTDDGFEPRVTLNVRRE